MKITAVVALAALVAGCGGAPKEYQPVNIIGDTYCEAARKRDWDVADTPKTIDGIRRDNAGWEARCGAHAKKGQRQ